MTGNDAARAFLESITGYTDDAQGDAPSQDRPVKLGTVDPAYSGAGNPRVKFDGESLMGVREYVALLPVAAGDRVVMLPVGRTYVVLGSVAGLDLEVDLAGDGVSGTLPVAHGGTGLTTLAALKTALGVPFAEAAGTLAPVSLTANQTNTTTVTFPVGRFTVPPVVVPSIDYVAATSLYVSVSDVTTTNFVLRRGVGLDRSSAPTFAAGWRAVQMTSGSAAG